MTETEDTTVERALVPFLSSVYLSGNALSSLFVLLCLSCFSDRHQHLCMRIPEIQIKPSNGRSNAQMHTNTHSYTVMAITMIRGRSSFARTETVILASTEQRRLPLIMETQKALQRPQLTVRFNARVVKD